MYLIRYILVVVLLYAGWCASLLIRTAVKVGFDMTCHETPWSGYGNPVVPALVEYNTLGGILLVHVLRLYNVFFLFTFEFDLFIINI